MKCKVTYEKGEVVVRMPYDGKPGEYGMSASGKSHLIAKTDGGFVTVEGSPDPNLFVQVNLISKVKKG